MAETDSTNTAFWLVMPPPNCPAHPLSGPDPCSSSNRGPNWAIGRWSTSPDRRTGHTAPGYTFRWGRGRSRAAGLGDAIGAEPRSPRGQALYELPLLAVEPRWLPRRRVRGGMRRVGRGGDGHVDPQIGQGPLQQGLGPGGHAQFF